MQQSKRMVLEAMFIENTGDKGTEVTPLEALEV